MIGIGSRNASGVGRKPINGWERVMTRPDLQTWRTYLAGRLVRWEAVRQARKVGCSTRVRVEANVNVEES